jgi:hypothetical protein
MDDYRSRNQMAINTSTIIRNYIKRGQLSSPTLIERTGFDICDYTNQIEKLLGEVKATGWGFEKIDGADEDLRITLDPKNIQKIPRD